MTALGLYRLLLRCYPKDFRKECGDDMVRLFLDHHHHGGASTWRILLAEMTDAAIAAPTLRWENQMTRIVWTAVAVAVALAVGLSAGLFVLVPLMVVATGLVLSARRHSSLHQPVEGSRRWTTWAGLGAMAATPGVIILLTADEELSAIPWTVMALSLFAGAALAVAGLVMAVSGPAATTRDTLEIR